MAQGFLQVPGVDYFDMFAPIAKLPSIQLVLAMADAEDLELHLIDIKGAYLTGKLMGCEVILMQQPPGSENLVCQLQKTMYGLKQSGRCWYQKLVEIMLTHLGFSQCDVDQAIFFRCEEWALIVDTNIQLTTVQSPSTTAKIAQMHDIPYHKAVRLLMYAALRTRPDIAFAVQTVSRFLTKPGPAHWEAVKRIFRYLKGSMELWLSYRMAKMDLTEYTDADGSMAEDRHAISGYVFLIHSSAISWSAKQQEIIALSMTEAEYVTITHASKEALWLHSLLFQIFNFDLNSTTLFSDNKSAIELMKDHQYHSRTKHIDIRFHFIQYIVEDGSICLIYCPMDDMIADALTKALPSMKAKHFASQFGLMAP